MSNPSLATRLEAAPDKGMCFLLNGQKLVPNDFHVTEIKKVSIASLDCGNGKSQWQELVIQLWSPHGDDAAEAMRAGKFATILGKADALPLLETAHVRFEYGAAGMPAIQYALASLNDTEEALELTLSEPHVACRPRLVTLTSELSVSPSPACCG